MFEWFWGPETCRNNPQKVSGGSFFLVFYLNWGMWSHCVGELRGYPACPWLPQSARPHREADHVVPDGCGEPDWHLTDRVFGHVTGCFCLGTLFRQLQVELLFSWKDQQRSGRYFLRPYCLLVPLVIEFTQLTLWRSSKRQIDCWDLTNPTRHQPWLILSSFQGWFVA